MKNQEYIGVIPAANRCIILAISIVVLTIGGCSTNKKLNVDNARPNVLFIAVDDLRPELGCYGDETVKSPNIDRLAKSGVLFSRAYCQQAVCSPSRTSLMTGRRPNTTKVWDLGTHFRTTIPDVVTLPQYFKNNGYHTQSIGKIYHDPAEAQDALSWSVPEILAVTKKEGKYVLPSNLQQKGAKAAATELADVPDNAYIDGQVADQALDVLKKIKDKPFFLAVGFRRPHLPFSAPKKYWDLYDREKIALPVQKTLPKNIPAYAAHKSEELRGYTDIGFNNVISDAKTRELLHGYYAAISYTDAQIGKVLAELDRLNLTKNTIIVLWSDHGFHLGEKGLWAKSTNYELDTRVPLIVAAPGKKQGITSNALVELVDLYPTLADLGGLGIPDGLEGTSMAPLLTQPDQPWKSAAFSQFPRPWQYKGAPDLMGYAIRTNDYRYVEWRDFKTGEVKEMELYDHRVDPDEINNIANAPANVTLVKELKQKLNDGWQYASKINPSENAGKKWFEEILKANMTTDSAKWAGLKRTQTWDELRGRFRDHESLMEMSWEERDNIWQDVLPVGPDKYSALARRYRLAYLVSCNERGIKPLKFDTIVNSLKELDQVRKIYLASRKAEYVILTPKPPKQPQINSAGVYGVRPGSEIIYRLAATGERPLKYTVSGLPAGCTFDAEMGVIKGSLAKEGKYNVVITAQNKHGKSQKNVAIMVGQTIALTPPMGWNSWNSFACNVTDADIRNTADQLIKTGLAEYGWSYINIDDCWMKVPDIANMPEGKEKAMVEPYFKENVDFRIKTKKVRFNEDELIGSTRDANGNVLSNKDFPDMKSLTDYLHKYGFKAGLYTSPGPLTCQRYEGSYKHEHTDAKQYANWGFDYLKYDWCGYRSIVTKPTLEEVQHPYRLMGQALKEVDRDIVYSLCQYGMKDVWKWGASIGGNVWRTTGDIRDNWKNMSRIGFSQAGLESYAGPGHWNDPDMLVVGYVGWTKNLRPTYLSPNEQYTHISLWSLLAAPLLIGCDLTRLDDFTYGLLSNPEVIAINQDPLGKQASRVINDKNIQVWSKPLSDGSIAVGVFNLGETPMDYQLSLASLQLSGKHSLRNVWKQENMGNIETSFTVSVNRHGVKLFRIK